jgi:hypothetical protein
MGMSFQQPLATALIECEAYYHQLTSGVELFTPRRPSSDIQGTGGSYPRSFDIAHRGSTEESAVLSVELASQPRCRASIRCFGGSRSKQ